MRNVPLRRSRDGRVLAGVAAGVAEHLDTDPLWVRLAFVVTTIWGGVGVLVYAVLWAALPAGDPVEAVLEGRLERGEIGGDEYRTIRADIARR